MPNSCALKIKLRLPLEVAQDLIVRHLRCATEWQQMPFDPTQKPIEIENLDGSFETDVRICCILPALLDSILDLVSSEGWTERYDPQTAISVGSTICAYALENGVYLGTPLHSDYSVRPYRPKKHLLSLN